MIGRCLQTLLRDRRGAAAVEFAIIGPIVLSLIAGTIEVSRYYYVRTAMNNAVDEAARYATIAPTPTDQQITTRFQAQDFGSLPDAGPSLTIGRGTYSATTQWISLSATYSVNVDFLFFRLGSMPVNATRRVYSAITVNP